MNGVCIKKLVRRRKNIINTISLSLGLALTMLVVALVFKPVFETNDDSVMRAILSGEYGNKYASNSIFLGYICSWVLSKLYMLNSSIPWYGLFFAGIVYLVGFFVIQDIIVNKNIDNKKKCLFIFLVGMTLFNAFVIQEFTTIAAICGGYACYCMMGNKYKIRSWIFLIICFEIRNGIFLLTIPFFIASYIWKNISLKIKQLIIKCVPVFLGSVLIFVLLSYTNNLSYKQSEWKEYSQFNKARSQLYDNTNFYGNEEYKEECLRAGISEGQYYLLKTYNIGIDNSISTNQLKECKKIVDDKKSDNIFIKCAKVAYYTMKNMLISFKWYTILAFILEIYLLLQLRNRRKRIFSGLVVCGKILIIFYFVWIARLPERIYFSLFIIEILFLIKIIGEMQEAKKKRPILNRVFYIGMVVFMGMLVGNRFSELKQLHSANKIWTEYIDMCNKESSNIYVTDVDSTCSLGEEQVFNEKNRIGEISSGGWLTKSPIFNEILKEKNVKDIGELLLEKNVFYVTYKGQDLSELVRCIEYKEKAELDYKLDKVVNDDFYVYKIRRVRHD